jgi:hypothetical protein
MEPKLTRSYSQLLEERKLPPVEDDMIFGLTHLKTIRGAHSEEITSIVKDEFNDLLFTGSGDGSIQIYDKVIMISRIRTNNNRMGNQFTK